MLDFTKPVTTASGYPVTFLSHDGPGGFPHIGYYTFPGGSEVTRWNNNGASEGFFVHRHLIQAEEPVVRGVVVEGKRVDILPFDGNDADMILPHIMFKPNARIFKLTFDGDQVTGELVK